MIKVSHESPLKLLKNSLQYNDYQYILPYFWFRYPEYKEFMLDYRNQKNSFIILDNGLFEGETYTINQLLNLINEIKPDIFIVPDEWNNSFITHVNAKYWMELKKSNVLPEGTEIMVVLQGKDFPQIKQLYLQCIDLGYKHYAFNHSSIAYEKGGIDKSFSRYELIEECIEEGIINKNHYIHLLGAININEFYLYNVYHPGIINSIDTSSPVLRGCNFEIYNYKNSMEKPKGKIEDFFDKDLTPLQLLNINYNIEFFKKLIKS